MAKGKFSQPRPYRDEEREIEHAFRQMTGQESKPEPIQPEEPFPIRSRQDMEELIPSADLLPEEDPAYDLPDPEPPRKPESFFSRNKKLVLLAVCAFALLAIVGIMALVFAGTADPYDGRILSNVYIANVNVGGMTKTEAVTALQQAASLTYSQQDMVVDLAGTTLTLKPESTKASLDIKAAVNAAFEYGRTGTRQEQEQIYLASQSTNHFIGLLPYLQLDQSYIRQVLTEYARGNSSTLTQAKYGLDGARPELATDKFDGNAPGQTLVITMGTPGIGFDVESVYKQILDAYSLHMFRVTIEGIEPVAEPDPVDLDAIYEEFYIAPVDASIDMQTFKTVPGAYGYGFDKEAAQALIDQAGYGEEIRIPMEPVQPEIMDDQVLFRDVLGSCDTPHNNNENRNVNLRLAAEALNGIVLNPGEEFSYNDALGERTAEKGYKPAPSYSGTETVDSIGGGICQGSSTLYYCVLLADLEVTDRINHGFVPTYIDYGMDATVSWGYPDFKFKNSTNFPIKIVAEVSDGYLRMKILGTDEKDYYIKMRYLITGVIEPEVEYEDHEPGEGYTDGQVIKNGVTGYYVKSYKQKFSKATDEMISDEFCANSSYRTVNKVVARVGSAEAPPTEAPPTEAPPAEAPPTEAPPAPPTDPPAPEGPNE